MALVFLNGGSPNYTGYQFSTSTDLIDTIETTLVAAGWVTDTKVSGVSLFIKGTSITGSDGCWMDFVVSGSAPNLTLTLRAWLQQAKTNSSGGSHTLTYTSGSTNRLWLTADQEAGCIALFNPTGSEMAGYHFGFLNRVDSGDQWAWMIGRLYASGIVYAYVAKAQSDATIWRQLGGVYQTGTTDPIIGASNSPFPVTTFDYLCQGGFGNTSSLTQPGGANVFYNAHLGQLNYNSQAIIVPYYGYIEGKTAASDYGSTGVFPTRYHRGFVKYAATGMASLGGAQQAVDPVTGYRYLSVGGVQWQAMRIL